jgi:molecular chaperone GrpE
MTEKDQAQDANEELNTQEPNAAAENDATDTEEAVADEVSALDALKSELEEALARVEENKDRVLRMQAEMENTRKRLTQEVDNARKYGQKSFIEELLPVCDSMALGLQAASEDNAEVGKIKEGYDLTFKMLEQLLNKFNVEVVDPVGEKFDPEKHQAMTMQEGTDQEANTVISVLQKGYTLNDRLIRPALVMVAK